MGPASGAPKNPPLGRGARTAVGLALAERLLAHGAPPLAADEQGHTTLALLSARRSVQRTRAKRPPSAVA